MRRATLALCIALLTPALARAQQAVTQPAAVTQFQKLEDSWSVALAGRDQYALENLMQPTFIDISAAGVVQTRNQSIADTITGLPQPLVSVEQKVVNVRVVSDVAVVEGTYKLEWKQGEHTRDERGIYTHVWERSHNAWSCVSAQRTAVVDQVEGGKGKAGGATAASAGEGATAGTSAAAEPAAKKSSASLPFHIPLLHKGADASQPAPASTATNPPQ